MAEENDSGRPESGAGESLGAGAGGARGKGASKHGLSLREELEQASAGLSYMSESDYPFRFFTLPAEGLKDLTAEGFLNCLGLSQQLLGELGVQTEQLVEEQSLEDFFPNEDDLAERHGAETDDPKVANEWKKLQQMLAALDERLRGVKVFRVGQVEIRCYIAGLDEQGNLAGLATTAIET